REASERSAGRVAADWPRRPRQRTRPRLRSRNASGQRSLRSGRYQIELPAPCSYNLFFMSLLVVGSVAYDGVETPHGKMDRMLGGAATYISLVASYFTPVKLVAVVGGDFAQEDIDLLASRQIDLAGLERVPEGKTFFWQ